MFGRFAKILNCYWSVRNIFPPLDDKAPPRKKTHQGNHPNISSSCQETINQAFLILPFKTDNQSQCFLKTVFLDGSRRYR